MFKLYNSINVAYNNNLSFVTLPFNKKYILILNKLLYLNLIHSFFIFEKFIKIKLKYYKNKPLFFFLIESKGGNKKYQKLANFIKNKKINSISFYFTDKGFLSQDELVFLHSGGEFSVQILYLNKNK